MSTDVAIPLIVCAVFGLPFLLAFGIPWIFTSLLPRLRWRRPRTPGAMLAYSMLHPATRDDWRKDHPKGLSFTTEYTNAKMGAKVTRCMGNANADFPLSGREGRLLAYAMDQHDRRATERKRLDALENVTAQFERAYGTNA